MASVEKTYADAMFVLLEEENAQRVLFDLVAEQLKVVSKCFDGTPDLFKLMNTPTITDDEKLAIINAAFDGKVNDYVRNFLRLLAVKKRVNYFPRIQREFQRLYNEKFGLAEIVIASAMPVSMEQRAKIVAKMSAIIGTPVENIVAVEEIDKSLIGGISVKYGNTRYDGSIKTRLNELAKNMADTVA
ncbi:MAG: ATP synthase F1 subunit delta [Oscillospiraceae bacterium]|nr:ATP synthase F1 subunit delta [Oscillospiraceae bacterium]